MLRPLALSTFGFCCCWFGYFETGSLPDLEFPRQAGSAGWPVTGPQELTNSGSPALVLLPCATMLVLKEKEKKEKKEQGGRGVGEGRVPGSKSGPHAFNASTLTTELSPQLSCGFSKVLNTIYLNIYS